MERGPVLNPVKAYWSFSFVGLSYGLGSHRSAIPPPSSDLLTPAEPGLTERIHDKLVANSGCFERMRLISVGDTDSRLRLMLPAASLGGLLFGFTALQSVIAGMLLAALFGAFAVAVTLGLAERNYRLAAKPAIVAMLAPFVSGFVHDPNPSNDTQRFETWRLFPRIKRIELEDRMICARGFEDLSISRVRFSFGPGTSKSRHTSLNNAAIVTEIGTSDQQPQNTIVVVSKRAGMTFRTAPVRRHKLQPFLTGDADFDDRYLTFTSDAAAARSVLTSTVRAAFLELERVSRTDARGFLSKLSSSIGQKSFAVLQPGYTAIVTPLPSFDSAFEPGPFGHPMEHEGAAERYAQDVIARERDIKAAQAFHAAVTRNLIERKGA